MNRMHPVKFVGGPAGEAMFKSVWGYRKYRYLFVDCEDGRHIFKYRRRHKGQEYHLEEMYVVPYEKVDSNG